MRIVIASDHGGYELKEDLGRRLVETGHQVEDLGTGGMESVDYPDYAIAAAERVSAGDADFGIVICKTGIGVSVAANKVKGIRAGLCVTLRMAEMSRRHNNANILAIGAMNQTPDEAWRMTEVFLSTPFEGDRHARRIDKITAYETHRPTLG